MEVTELNDELDMLKLAIRKNPAIIDVIGERVTELSNQVIVDPANNTIDIDVANKVVNSPNGDSFNFELESHFQEMLLGGLDFISLTMKREKQINSFIQQDKLNRAWAHLK